MKKVLRILGHIAWEIIAASLLAVIIYLCLQGMWLRGLPKEEQVRSITLSGAALSGETITLTDAEEIERALKLTGFLHYRLFAGADESDEPLVTMTLHLSDGTERTLSAGMHTVWWQGRARALRQPELFVNLTEGLFGAAEGE